MELKPHEFNSTREFLLAGLEAKRQKNERFSVRAWSRQLGFKNPSYLSEVLRGKRAIKPHFINRIAQNLKLTKEDHVYLETLSEFENAKTTQQKDLFLKQLRQLKPSSPIHSVELDLFHLIADWYHLALLESLSLSPAQLSPKELGQRLRPAISESQTRTALNRLKRLGLVEVNEDGQISRKKSLGAVFVDHQVPHESVRKFHKQMIKLAFKAVDEQDFSERSLEGSTVALKAEDLQKAKDLIKECHKEIMNLSRDKDADAVYFLGSQFFSLTENKNKENHE